MSTPPSALTKPACPEQDASQDSGDTDKPYRQDERPTGRHGTVCRYATIEATSTSVMAPVTSGIMERPRI